MYTINQLIKAKAEGRTVTINQNDTVYHALMLMANHNIGAVIVVDDDGQMVGIFTERDYARKVILMGRTSLETKLSEIMTRDVLAINPETSLEECMSLMTHWHIRHLPVVHEGKMIDLVSMRDVVEAIIANREDTIQDLEKFILGHGYTR